MIWRGDFPGIYVPAKMFLNGATAQLYDRAAQAAWQNEFWPSLAGEFYISSYPQHSVILTLPVAPLPAANAKIVWTALMLLAATSAIFVFSAKFVALAYHDRLLLLMLWPILLGVLSGQNNGLSLLLFAAGLVGLQSPAPKARFAAGCCFGIWLFKPQYALYFAMLALLRRELPVVAGIVAVTAGYLIFDYWFFGADWLSSWLVSSSEFTQLNFIQNGHQMVSLAALGYQAFAFWSGAGIPAYRLALTVTACCSLVLLLVTRRRKQATDAYLLTAVFVPLLAPQTLFYDLSVSIVALVALRPEHERRRLCWLLFVGFTLAELGRHCVAWPIYGLFYWGVILWLLTTKKLARTLTE